METNKRVIFTGMNADNWQVGLKWVRSVKQIGVQVAVVNTGLTAEQVDKLQELDVDVIAHTKKTGVQQVDLFNSFIPYAEENLGKYVFWDVNVAAGDITPLWGVWTFGAAKGKEKDIGSLVYPLTVIDARVRLGNRLESEVVAEYDGALDGDLMAGTLDGWKLFVGFYNNLVETGTIESMVPARALAVNLFALYFKEWVEAKPIAALQLENLG